ncbi:MAG: phospholipid carrier-dependent glycosyltransferase [Planctomycetes bacterium]|nr:phospholipid carrier-dependent glycosyltransferase [Planctomycetota bacterium]
MRTSQANLHRSPGIRWQPACSFLLLFACIHVPWAALRPLAAPDEIRYAEIAREMLATGDWIVPHLAGAPYLEKPPLGIWLGALAQALCGRSPIALRLPALLSTLITGLLLARFLRQRGRGAREAWGTASIFASLAFVQAIGSAHVLDPLLSCALAGATLAFASGAMASNPSERRAALWRAGLWLGAAFLVKGFVAVALLLAAALPFGLLSPGGRNALRGLPWMLGTAVLLALPWGLAIAHQEPLFWHRFFWVEHVQRFLHRGEAQHSEPIWYFLPVLIGGALPWLPLLGLARSRSPLDAELHPVARLAGCWVLGPLLFLSASSGKLGTYLMPCFPGLALGIGCLLHRRAVEIRPGVRIGLRALGLAVALGTGAVIYACVLRKHSALHLPDPSMWSALLWSIGGLGSSWLFWRAARAASARQLRRRVAWCLVPLGCAAALAFPRSIQGWRQPERTLSRHLDWLRSTDTLFAEYRLLVSLCWSLGTTEIELVDKSGELDSRRLHLPLSISALNLRLQGEASRQICLVCRASWWNDHARELPEPAATFEDEGIVFARFATR